MTTAIKVIVESASYNIHIKSNKAKVEELHCNFILSVLKK